MRFSNSKMSANNDRKINKIKKQLIHTHTKHFTHFRNANRRIYNATFSLDAFFFALILVQFFFSFYTVLLAMSCAIIYFYLFSWFYVSVLCLGCTVPVTNNELHLSVHYIQNDICNLVFFFLVYSTTEFSC